MIIITPIKNFTTYFSSQPMIDAGREHGNDIGSLRPALPPYQLVHTFGGTEQRVLAQGAVVRQKHKQIVATDGILQHVYNTGET